MDVEASDKKELLRIEYQQRLDAGERIAQLARENEVSPSTMRWRLTKLGVDLNKKRETDGRYASGYNAKFRVSMFHGVFEVQDKLNLIAKQHAISVAGLSTVDEMLQKILEELVSKYSNIQIGEIMGVNEKSVRKWCQHFGIQTLRRGDWATVRAGKVEASLLLLIYEANNIKPE